MWIEDVASAVLLTWLLDFAFCYFRQSYGTAMITAKSMIDERFLV